MSVNNYSTIPESQKRRAKRAFRQQSGGHPTGDATWKHIEAMQPVMEPRRSAVSEHLTAAEVREMLRLGSTLDDYENLTRLARAYQEVMELHHDIARGGLTAPLATQRRQLLRAYHGEKGGAR